MSITHGLAIRTVVADAVCTAVNGGTGLPNGVLVFLPASGAACATLNMSGTAFAAAVSGVATANGITSDTNAAGGVTTKFEIRNRASVAVILGTVGTSASDINLSSTNIGAGDTVTVSSLTYTAMP